MLRSAGTLLDGRVRYDQPVEGYRTGIEPVLLAATIPAQAGQRVLEAGTGAGAGLLCLMARVPGLIGAGIEADPAMAETAVHNLAQNGVTADIHVRDIGTATVTELVDHAFANPPWHDPASTPSPDRRRSLATHRGRQGLAPWVRAMAQSVVPNGTVSLILPARLADEGTGLLRSAGFAGITTIPLWPRVGRPAKIVILHASRHGEPRLHRGLVLHGDGSAYTAETDAILRGGACLQL